MTRGRAGGGLLLLVLLLALTRVHLNQAPSVLYSVDVAEAPSSVVVDAALGRIFLTTAALFPYTAAGTATGAERSDHLRVLDLARGTALGALPLALASPTTVLAEDAVRHRLFVGGTGAGLQTIDAVQGVVGQSVAVAQSVSLGWPVAVAVDRARGQALVLCVDGTLGVLDTPSGRLLRQIAVGHWTAALALDPRTHTLFVSGRTGDRGWVRLLDAASLRPRRILGLGTSAGALAIAGPERRVFVLRPADKRLSMLSMRGTLLHTAPVGQSEGVGVLVVDAQTERVFVANTRDNTVSVLNAQSDRVVRTVQVGHQPDALLVDNRADRIVVVNTASGTLSLLDARSGLVRRTLVVGADPVVAVDAASGHVVVGSTPAPPPPTGLEWLAQQVPWLPLPAVPPVPALGRVTLFNISQ